MHINELNNYLNLLLQPERFSDYCPNGLQVEGKTHISKIVTGVTASMALLEAALQADADAILVHHG
ncbi:MAG TPA: Nif3-like dinuclear metal center hexameric protein, partial [Methylotenera sp.]|nr:Nif3-like dinuclear metal center hexameric protein [Methylotenera sp.]